MLAVRHVLFVAALLLLCGIVPAVGAAPRKKNEAKEALSIVKQYVENAKESVEEVYKKAATPKNALEEVLKAVRSAQSEAEDLKKTVEAGVEHDKATDVKKKAQKAMTASRTAKQLLIKLSESSNIVKVEAIAAAEIIMAVMEEATKVVDLPDSPLSEYANTVSKHAEVTRASLAEVKNGAESSCTESMAAQESAENAESNAKKAADHSELVEGIGTESADVMHTGFNKKEAERYAEVVANSAGKTLEKAQAAADKSTTAFDNAEKAFQAAQQMVAAVEAAEEAAENVAKQTQKGVLQTKNSQKSIPVPPEQHEHLNEEPARTDLDRDKNRQDVPPLPPQKGPEGEQHQDALQGPPADAHPVDPAAQRGGGNRDRQDSPAGALEQRLSEGKAGDPSALSAAPGNAEDTNRAEELPHKKQTSGRVPDAQSNVDQHAVTSQDVASPERITHGSPSNTSPDRGAAAARHGEKDNTDESPNTDAESAESIAAGETHSASGAASAADAMNAPSGAATTGEDTTANNEGADGKATSPVEVPSNAATTDPTLALSGISSGVNTNQDADGDGRSACVSALLLLLLAVMICVAVE
ncbi:hypothetical protein DQ04_16971000 [Trypanosoma grayi]|uniref:hypothetical protein n=1 Tax=Trypanosoma grayi TaxID=71804 RepID=UPI0004F472AF|nr:hypothetical protein DQ04_16971000 [Trypanosoma grayi]KEG05963.1 hypothetical protein DQ04_16971000 [Trypanosoma grayi]